MVFISSESGDKQNIFYDVHSDWHKVGIAITNQIISFLDFSSLQENGKTGVISSLNTTLNVLGSAMYHLHNYSALEKERIASLKTSAPEAASSRQECLVIIPDLQCELQAFLVQVQRSFDTLPDLIKPILSVPKGFSFGECGENFLDVMQDILISDIADVRKHPIEKLVRLIEQGHDFSNVGKGKKRPWLRFLAEFRKHAMKEERPVLAAFKITGPVESGTVKIQRPMFNDELPLVAMLEKIWDTALDFHRDFYSLTIFWTLGPKYSFTMLSEKEQGPGKKWAVINTSR